MNSNDKRVMFSKSSDHWSTPKNIYDHFIHKLNYYDPCPLYDDSTDLNIPLNKKMFINPPYSDIKSWVRFAIQSHIIFKKDIYMLIPSRTDTKYFHELLLYGIDLYFYKGRLKFGDSKNSAPFPSVLVKLTGKDVSVLLSI